MKFHAGGRQRWRGRRAGSEEELVVEDREAKALIEALGELLEPHLARSSSLRRAAAIFGRWLVEQADRGERTPAPDSQGRAAAGGVSGPVPMTQDAAPAPAAASPEETAQPAAPAGVDVSTTGPGIDAAPPALTAAELSLRLGDAAVEVSVRDDPAAIESARRAAEARSSEIEDEGDEGDEREPLDLELIAQRSRLKAEGCRLAVERRAAGPAAAWDHALQERIRGVLARAKPLTECFVWALWREKEPPADGPLRTIASCYEALAEAAEAMVQVDRPEAGGDAEDAREAMLLLAEAQSMLRTALEGCWLTRADQDQLDAYGWLRFNSALRQVFIERHMRLDDPADPANSEDLRARIASLVARVRSRLDRVKRCRQAINRLRHHARLLHRDGGDDAAHHWNRIAASLQELADGGVRPSDLRVREALGTAAELQPPAASTTALLNAALAAAAASGEADGAPEDSAGDPERGWSERVARARALLAGGSLVLIGGEPRAEAIARLQDALGAGAVYWPPLSEHGSGAAMRAPIERPDTAAVAVIIKLTGHLHAESAREYARGAGKPCILLKAGYSPEQVAAALLEQAEEQLSQRLGTQPGE